MKIAIMQPYFCPHVGYFQLVDAVDTFIFYDDVQYIKNGYINRNTLKNNSKFTIPVCKKDVQSMKSINQIKIDWQNPFFRKFPKTLNALYKNSKNYNKVISIINELFDTKPKTISDLACRSIQSFSNYLGIKTKFLKSSEIDYFKTNDRSLNLINICKSQSCSHYINAIGGQKLYDHNFFSEHGVKLNFLQGQISNSIIDEVIDQSLKEYLVFLKTTYKLT